MRVLTDFAFALLLFFQRQKLPYSNHHHCKELIYTVNIPEGVNAKVTTTNDTDLDPKP